MARLTNTSARRIALAAQGFPGRKPGTRRPGVAAYRKVFNTIGLLQLDSVNVLSPSHYLPMYSRVGAYDRNKLDRFTSHSGEIFEYWGHAASLLPVDTYPLFHHRMEGFGEWKRIQKLLAENPKYIDSVYNEIADNGPLRVGDLEDGGDRKGSWWGWADGKTVLEWLFATGRITGYRDAHFGRVYDLTERVIPEKHLNAPAMSQEAAYRTLLEMSARHHGVGTADDLLDYYRLHGPTARPILESLADDGVVRRIEVEGWARPAFLHPEATRPRSDRGTALLSPFDPVVWYRDRAERLFDFHYRIEIYVPKPKRQFGYYVLPFLLDGKLVGRVDLKADRQAGVLRAQACHVEVVRDQKRVGRAMYGELQKMASWLELDDVVVERKGNLAIAVRKASS